MSKEKEVKVLRARIARDKLQMKKDQANVANFDEEVMLVKSDAEARLAQLTEDKARMEKDIEQRQAEIERSEKQLQELLNN